MSGEGDVEPGSGRKKGGARRRLRRAGWALLVVLGVMPWLVLHGAALLLRSLDRPMSGVVAGRVGEGPGEGVRFYLSGGELSDVQVLFIHGTPGAASNFRQAMANPFQGVRFVAYDRPGFGATGGGGRRPGLAEQAAVLDAWLAKGVRTILVGHSYGAPIALRAALDRPDVVSAVILVGGSVDPAQESVGWLQRLGDRSWVSWSLPREVRQCNRELLGLKADLEDLAGDLGMLGVPVVMIHGARDRLVPVANVSYLRDELGRHGKGALLRVVLLEGGNHFIPWEEPGVLMDEIGRLVGDWVH